MAYRSLGELRSIVLARLGMGAMGASGGANGTLIDSFLSNGQFQLYWMQNWKHLEDWKEVNTGVTQNRYDYPTGGTMDPDIGCARDKRILRIETQLSGQWVPVTEGITTAMWSTMSQRSNPQRFERLKQVLIYPEADAVYKLRFWFISDLLPFTQPSDVATLDDEMVLLHAIANAKAHYRQPDAPTYQGQLDALLGSLRGQSFTSGGVVRRRENDNASMLKPVVVGRT